MSDAKLARMMPVWEGQGQKLCERIIRRAGYTPPDPRSGIMDAINGGEYDDEYQMLLATLGYIGARKVDDYGDFRMQDIRSFDREIWGAYWDIQRKFGRLEQQLKSYESSLMDHVPVDDILETLSDQAVYCVRMIQILKRLEEKGLVPK